MNNTEQGQDKPDLLKRMASVVGHEIRNPLAIISNSIYFIKRKLTVEGAELDPKVAKHIGIIEGEVKHSNDIIEEILLFTRPKELNRGPASVNALVKDLAAYYQVPPAVTLKTLPDPAEPRADMDVEAITYAVRCAVDNAVQAMPEGGTVELAVSSDGKLAAVTVTDSGPGFADGDGEKVFAPFFTTKPRGVGLGLTIARKFLEQQGGSARAENAPGRGARVILSLPQLR